MALQYQAFIHVRMAQRPRTWRKTFLREWREACGKTLESVSPQMGLTHGQLSKIERGLHPYSQRVLEVAALEYGCTVLDVLGRPPPATAIKNREKARA